jgi:ABC-type sugar transport system substrate-binding protein
MRKHLKDGTVRSVLLWNAPDHGYLTVYAARQLARGGFTAGQPFNAGRMGRVTPRRDEVSMQVALPVLEFTRDNVDRYRF